MYTSQLIAGARSREAVEQALRLALPTLGLVVREAVDVANVSELWERRRNDASVAIGRCGTDLYGVDVRGPRSPSWNNELARRLSQHLGGWATSLVNDRLLDEYGRGYFLDGLVIEAAVCNRALVVERLGFPPEVPDRAIFDSLDEERNRANFRLALEKVAGPYISPWPPSGAMRLLFVEGDGITVSELPRPASTLLVTAGHEERIDVPGFEYDIDVAEDTVRVLVARTHLPLWELAERVDHVRCVAFFTDGERCFVRKTGEASSVECHLRPLRAALDAWDPVCFETQSAPMAFTFDAARAASPWR